MALSVDDIIDAGLVASEFEPKPQGPHRAALKAAVHGFAALLIFEFAEFLDAPSTWAWVTGVLAAYAVGWHDGWRNWRPCYKAFEDTINEKVRADKFL